MRHDIRQPPTSRLSEDCNVDCKTIDSVLVRHMSMIWSSQFRRINFPGLCDLAVFALVFLELCAIFLEEWCVDFRDNPAFVVFYTHLKGRSYTFLTLGNDRLPTFYKMDILQIRLYIFHNLKSLLKSKQTSLSDNHQTKHQRTHIHTQIVSPASVRISLWRFTLPSGCWAALSNMSFRKSGKCS